MKLNKKGSIQDLVFVGIIVLFFAVVVLIGFKVVSEFNSEIQSNSAIAQFDTGSHARAASTELTGHYTGVIDNTFLFFAIGLALATLMLAVMVRIHPIFIPFYFIGLVLIIFFSGIFSNIYQEMAATTQLATQADQLIFISNILEFLPFIVGIFGIILMVIMYKTWKDGQI
jgi:hypothetical protein